MWRVLRTPHAQVSGPCTARLRARGKTTRTGLDAENGVLASRRTGKQTPRLAPFLQIFFPARPPERSRGTTETLRPLNRIMRPSVEEGRGGCRPTLVVLQHSPKYRTEGRAHRDPSSGVSLRRTRPLRGCQAAGEVWAAPTRPPQSSAPIEAREGRDNTRLARCRARKRDKAAMRPERHREEFIYRKPMILDSDLLPHRMSNG